MSKERPADLYDDEESDYASILVCNECLATDLPPKYELKLRAGKVCPFCGEGVIKETR